MAIWIWNTRVRSKRKAASEAAEEAHKKIKAAHDEALAAERLAAQQKLEAEVARLTDLTKDEAAEKAKFSEKIQALEAQIFNLQQTLTQKVEETKALEAKIATLEQVNLPG